MSTSGTVGQTVIQASDVYESAARKCGLLPMQLAPEHLDILARNLYLLFCELTSRAPNLWCVKEHSFGLFTGRADVVMLPGTVRDLNLNWRTPTALTPAGTSFDAISATWDLGVSQATTPVKTLSILSGANQNLTLAIDTSADGITWTTLSTETQATAVALGEYVWRDIKQVTPNRYFRLRETVLASAPMTANLIAQTNFDLPMTPFNRDEYQQLPNKQFQSGRVLQYYFDRQLSPSLKCWPVANSTIVSQTCIYGSLFYQVQDVGAMTNQVAIPDRWLTYAIWKLADQSLYELPGADLKREQGIQNQVAMAMDTALAGEVDTGPIHITPRIGVYTRIGNRGRR